MSRESLIHIAEQLGTHQRREQRDDGHHHQHFNQRDTALGSCLIPSGFPHNVSYLACDVIDAGDGQHQAQNQSADQQTHH